MAAITIPPWLNINPTEPVGQMLHGYGLGLQASEAQAANAARAQQQQLAQQQAAELNAYRQQEQALADRKFTEELRLQQAKAQREAADAAQQLQGMQELQRRTGAGEPFEKVWPDVAPKILVRHPQALAPSIEKLLPPAAPIPGMTPEGVRFMQGANVHYVPPGLQPPETGPVSAVDVIGQGGQVLGPQFYRSGRFVKPVPTSTITPQAKISGLRVVIFSLERELQDATTDADKTRLRKEITDMRKTLKDTALGTAVAPAAPAEGPPETATPDEFGAGTLDTTGEE